MIPTIQELKSGKVVLINDGTADELKKEYNNEKSLIDFECEGYKYWKKAVKRQTLTKSEIRSKFNIPSDIIIDIKDECSSI